MKIKTIRVRITLWFSILFLILSANIMVFLFFAGQSVVRGSTRENLRTLVEDNLEELEYLGPDEQPDYEKGDHFLKWRNGTLEIDDDFKKYSAGVYISLYDENLFLYGENPIYANPSAYPPSDGQIQTIKQGRDTYLIYDAKTQNEELKGLWLRGIVNRQENVPLFLRVGSFMLFVLPFLALIAIYGGYQLARRALKPLSDISEQASSINSGSDLSKRIQVENPGEEASDLIDAFNAMLGRLQNSFETEKEFTSDASHELRTPAAVILAECEYALEEEDPAEWKESLEVISRQGAKMSKMIEDLLTFTRIEQRTVNINWEEINLTETALEVCLEQEKIRRKNIRMHLRLNTPVYIRGDRSLLERLIQNLVANAYQYGKESGNIYVETREENGRRLLSVKDDGIGIPEEELPNIWKRFYRTDSVRKAVDSTGLGLAIVRQIASIHHAEVKVFSKIGEGSTFLIIF